MSCSVNSPLSPFFPDYSPRAIDLPRSISIASKMASSVGKEDGVMSSEEKTHSRDLESGTPEYDEAVLESSSKTRARELRERGGILSTLCRGEDWLDAKMGIETQGIDLIREEDKQPPSILNVFLMWFSMTCHVGTVPIGMLGPEWGLSLNQSIAGCVIGTVLGAMCVGFCGTLGPKVRTTRFDFSSE